MKKIGSFETSGEQMNNDAAPYPKRLYSPGAPLPELQNSRLMSPFKNILK